MFRLLESWWTYAHSCTANPGQISLGDGSISASLSDFIITLLRWWFIIRRTETAQNAPRGAVRMVMGSDPTAAAVHEHGELTRAVCGIPGESRTRKNQVFQGRPSTSLHFPCSHFPGSATCATCYRTRIKRDPPPRHGCATCYPAWLTGAVWHGRRLQDLGGCAPREGSVVRRLPWRPHVGGGGERWKVEKGETLGDF